MDRRVANRRTLRLGPWLALAAVVAILAWVARDATGERTLRVDGGHLIVSPVTQGVFDDFIPIRGQVTPLETIFLDAVEGGRVERVMVSEGDDVAAGQELVELSNTTLQLDVLARETAVAEQLNTLRSIELALEQNRQSHQSRLVDLDFEIKRRQRDTERQRRLFREGIAAESTLADAEDALAHVRQQRAVTLDNQRADLRLQGQQVAHLRTSADQLVRNLELARRNLANLVVRAPMAGRLSGFEIEVGQSVAPGRRLGQIDAPDQFKLTARVDEFYLDRVVRGIAASYRGDRPYQLHVDRIRPQVQSGQFVVELVFEGEPPPAIRRGQTLQVSLTLGDSSDAALVRSGAFLQETGGNWVFVVSADGSEARRRTVRTGRRNPNVVEILDGLAPGDRIITSSYAGYDAVDRLTITDG